MLQTNPIKQLLLTLLLCWNLLAAQGAPEKGDSICYVLNSDWDAKKFSLFKEGISLNKVRNCIKQSKFDVLDSPNFFPNLFNVSELIDDQRKRKRVIVFLIKKQKKLAEPVKNITNQQLVWVIQSCDQWLNKKVKKIKENFYPTTYYLVLKKIKKRIEPKLIEEIEKSFKEKELQEFPNVQNEKWASALLLAQANQIEAEDYLIERARFYINNIDRSLLYLLGTDLAKTQNRRLINFIIDEYLMSDYNEEDFDTRHNDFSSAANILNQIVDQTIIREYRIKYPNFEQMKTAVRQWFRDNRSTYKIKP